MHSDTLICCHIVFSHTTVYLISDAVRISIFRWTIPLERRVFWWALTQHQTFWDTCMFYDSIKKSALYLLWVCKMGQWVFQVSLKCEMNRLQMKENNHSLSHTHTQGFLSKPQWLLYLIYLNIDLGTDQLLFSSTNTQT